MLFDSIPENHDPWKKENIDDRMDNKRLGIIAVYSKEYANDIFVEISIDGNNKVRVHAKNRDGRIVYYTDPNKQSGYQLISYDKNESGEEFSEWDWGQDELLRPLIRDQFVGLEGVHKKILASTATHIWQMFG